MNRSILKVMLVLGLGAAVWLWSGDIPTSLKESPTAVAEAIIGRPRTPISYAGVARRSTVGPGAPGVGLAPGVGAGGIGGPASGVGVLPGAGVGQAGVGYSRGVGVNLGGPVNRVGIR